MDPSTVTADLERLRQQTQRLRQLVIGMGAILIVTLIVGATLAATAGQPPSDARALTAHLGGEVPTSMAGSGTDPHGADPDTLRAERERVVIEGDDDLHRLAEREAWSGDGTESSPYVIADHKILVQHGTAILVKDTDAHIIIWQNIIEASAEATGIELVRAPHVNVKENTITGAGDGVLVDTSPTVHLERNLLQRNEVGIQLQRSPDVRIVENNLTANGAAIRVGTTGSMTSDRVTITNNTFHVSGEPESPDFGIILYATNAEVADNTFHLHAGLGIMDRGTDNHVSHNRFTGPSGTGIQVGTPDSVGEGDRAQLRGNKFTGIDGTHVLVLAADGVRIREHAHTEFIGEALRLDGAQRADVRANAVTRGTEGIVLIDTHQAHLEDNAITATNRSILAIGGATLTVQRNTVDDPIEVGIAAFDTESARVIGNTVRGGQGHGIFIGETARGTDVLANEIGDVPIGIGVAGDAAKTEIRSNVVSGAHQAIRLGNATEARLVDNRIDSADAGIRLGPGADGVHIQGGYVLSSGWGIFTDQGADDLTVHDAWLAYNGIAAWLIGTERATLTSNTIEQNGQGVFMLRGGNASLHANHLTDNRVGIHLTFTEGNTIYDNLLANDQLPGDRNAWIQNAPDNAWFTPMTEGTNIAGGAFIAGNLWHDYVGVDADQDGVGDVPYSLVPEADAMDQLFATLGEDPAPRDDHPLMSSGPVATPPPQFPPEDLPSLPPSPVPLPEEIPTPEDLWKEIPWPEP